MRNRRFLVVPLVLLGFVLMFALAATVAAVPPDKEPTEPLEPFVISGACAFDVLVDAVFDRGMFKAFYDQEDHVRRFAITGALRVRLTNLSSGESIDLNVSGPAFVEPQPDGTTLVAGPGPWLHFFIEDLPALALVRGRTEFLIDQEGNWELLSVAGNVQDVCQMLADS
ncbi:MAG TPA: hypothetical protein VK879_18170 [Candidatus Sulfomarinibacteraceae bacterium]|nr:hypothetical protein [Candidatus Sulfomarinibacteraceae bacterium]